MRRFAVAALLLSAALPAYADDVATAIKLRDAATKGSEAYAITESLTTEVGPRLAATEAEARARDWAVAKLTKLGFSNVRVEPFDMPAWERGTETLSVVSPFPQSMIIAALGKASPDMPWIPLLPPAKQIWSDDHASILPFIRWENMFKTP